MAKAFYVAKENGRTKNKAGKVVKFKRGDIIEGDSNDFAHCPGLEKQSSKKAAGESQAATE